MSGCEFCERYITLKDIYKWKRIGDNYIRYYFRSSIIVKTFNKFGECGRYTTKSMKLKYCPECGRRLNGEKV